MATSNESGNDRSELVRDRQFMQFFWALAAEEAQQRVQAVRDLVHYLVGKQNQLRPKNGVDKNQLSPHLTYSIKRLSKGLSGQETARHGFTLALIEVLSTFKYLNANNIYEQMLKDTDYTEEKTRERCFGRISGMVALSRSNRLNEMLVTPEGNELLNDILTSLMEIPTIFPNLTEPSYEALCSVLDQVPEDLISTCVVPKLKPVLDKEPSEYTVEMLALGIKLASSKQMKFQVLFPKWKHDLIHENNITRVNELLHNTTTSHPLIHSAWNYILDYFIFTRLHDEKFIYNFWMQAINSFFHEARLTHWNLGLRLVEKAVVKVSEHQVQVLFTKEFVNALINCLTQPNQKITYSSATSLVSTIQSVTKGNANLSLAVLMKFSKDLGAVDFDKKTKTDLLQSLVVDVTGEGIKSYMEYLQKIFVESSTEETLASKQCMLLDQMYTIIKLRKFSYEDSILLNLLQFFAFIGLFELRDDINAKLLNKKMKSLSVWFSGQQIATKVRNYSKKIFFDSLGLLSDTKRYSDSSLENGEDKSNLITKFNHLLLLLIEFEDSLQTNQIAEEYDDEVQAVRQKSIAVAKSLNKQSEKKANEFQLFILTLLINLHSTEFDEDEVLGALDDLCEVHQRLFVAKQTPTKKKKKEASEEEPSPMEVLIEIIVSTLTKPSTFVRNVTVKVFKAFSSELTPQTLNLVLEPLDPKRDMEEDAEEDAEEDGHDHHDHESHSEGSDEEDEQDDEDSQDDSNIKLDEHTVARLQDLVGATEDDEEDDEMIDPDQEDEMQLKRIDAALAEVFKNQKRSKGAQRSTIEFQLRVLDLVEVLIHHLSEKSLIFNIIIPLTNAATKTEGAPAKVLVDRAASALNKLFKVKHYPQDVGPTERAQLEEIANNLWEHATAKKRTSMTDVANNGILFIVRVLHGNQISLDQTSLIEKIRSAFSTFYSKHSSLNEKFFSNLFTRNNEVGWIMIDDILNGVKSARNDFYKRKCFSLLNTFITSKTISEEDAEKFVQAVPSIVDSFSTLLEGSLDTSKLKDSLSPLEQLLKAWKSTSRDFKVWNPKELSSIVMDKLNENKQLVQSGAIKAAIERIHNLIGLEAPVFPEVIRSEKNNNNNQDKKIKRKAKEQQPEQVEEPTTKKQKAKKQKVEKVALSEQPATEKKPKSTKESKADNKTKEQPKKQENKKKVQQKKKQ